MYISNWMTWYTSTHQKIPTRGKMQKFYSHSNIAGLFNVIYDKRICKLIDFYKENKRCGASESQIRCESTKNKINVIVIAAHVFYALHSYGSVAFRIANGTSIHPSINRSSTYVTVFVQIPISIDFFIALGDAFHS